MPSIISATTTNGLSTSADNSGSLQLATNNGTTALTIGTSQNVGIGTTNPNTKLVVSDNGAAGFELDATGVDSGPYFQAYNRSTSAFIPLTTQSSYIAFRTGSSPTERMRIDSSGRVTTPFQTSSSYSRSGNITYTSAAEFIYNLSRVDIGSPYSTSTGRFTAPVRGVYIASASAYAVNGSGLASISLRKNGAFSQNPIIQLSRNGSDYQTLTATATFFMEVGDYLSVNWEGGSIYIDSNTAFSVALLG